MKVLFLKDVPGVAGWGDTKEVSEGYARNFLFPKKLAVFASEQTIKEFDERKTKIARRAAEELKFAQDVASRIDGYEIDIVAKASGKGKLYGGIGAQKIVSALKERGFDVKKTQIVVPGGMIKEPGRHTAIIRFEHGLEAELKLNIVEEEKI